MELLNLGCGSRFHESWTNVDFISNSKNVIAHNLLKGIPFENESFNVVYHSHVLEHFTRPDGEKLIAECYRVLKPNGYIRIAVPDLEQITREYLHWLELALAGTKEADHNYEWIKIEMYDQTVRTFSGGEMGKYFFQENIPNEDYVYKRLGEEGRNIRKLYLNQLANSAKAPVNGVETNAYVKRRKTLREILRPIKNKLRNRLFSYEFKHIQQLTKDAELSRFRLSGEVHQWMYDRYSLSKLLYSLGFNNAEVKDAFTSNIPDWNSYELESKNGVIYKPDSLFMEAKKM